MKDLKIIFAGSGEFGLPSLRTLFENGYAIVQVVTQPDRPAGRGRALTPTPIGAFATEQKLPLLKTANINAEQLPAADLMIVIAFGQKIAPHIVDHPRRGSVNLHASLLPKYRGAAPINWAIINGESITGNSIIRLAQRMDAGAILAQSHMPIGELETAGELHDRLAADGAPLIRKILEDLAADRLSEIPQDESQATIAPKLSREMAKIDWTQPSIRIADRIRGMFPWPGCRVRIIGASGDEVSRVTLVRARAVSESFDHARITPEGIIGGGSLQIIELQPEGKRPMSLEAYRNGHRWESGMRVESI